jgi:hypothetical protein
MVEPAEIYEVMSFDKLHDWAENVLARTGDGESANEPGVDALEATLVARTVLRLLRRHNFFHSRSIPF